MTTSQHETTIALSRQFEDFVERIFTTYSIEMEKEVPLKGTRFRADFIATSADGVKAVIEVKFFRTHYSPARTTQQAIKSLQIATQNNSFGKILVVNSMISEAVRNRIHEIDKDIVIYDYNVLHFMCSRIPGFLSELETINSAGMKYAKAYQYQEPALDRVKNFIGEAPISQTNLNRKETSPEGPRLIEELDKLHAGPKTAKKYETLCEKILKLTLQNDLSGWNPQKTSSSSLHRYDLIARVKSKHDFWQSLVSDFRSRYIIFEFKNYKSKISQSEIYTTEKYLMPLAMRGTAIIVSRKGPNKNALSVIAGALREQGKLIISLTDSDLKNMLELYEDNEDPTGILMDKLDDVLQALER